jgi:hypothetical protein
MSSDRPVTEVGDFADVLAPQGELEPPVVVGGHAVNLWSSYFLSGGDTSLAKYLPFTSKDLDFVGTVDQLEALHRRFKGTKKMGQPRSPVVGRLELPFGDGFRIVELLHTVKGLSFEELKRYIDISVAGISARVLDPQIVLKAKIENSATIDQEGRNDVKHVAMMIRCNRAFIRELLLAARGGQVTARQVVNVLEEIRGIVLTPMAVRATALWGFDFSTVWPMAELAGCGIDKIEKFARMRLMAWEERMSGVISVWHYDGFPRNYHGYHFNADTAGCAFLKDLIERLRAGWLPEGKGFKLTAPTAPQLAVPNCPVKCVPATRLELRCRRDGPADHFGIEDRDGRLVIDMGHSKLADFERGIDDVLNGKGDWAIHGVGRSLWFWW